MKPSTNFPEVLDLSFLSAEEEAAILKVLQRDEELRKCDTGRQRRLKATTPDPVRVRVMTGEWFEDLKAKRYGQPCDITAVVKSSMRRKRTPAPKINPFMTYTATEGRGDSNQLSTSRHLPAFAEETYREYTDEDFDLNDEPSSSDIGQQKSQSYRDEGAKQPAGKSSNPFLDPSTPASTAASAPGNHSPGVNDLPPAENRSFAFMPFKSSATPKDAVTPAESSRMVSLPPALRKGGSVEDSWVKISVEPNTVTQSDLKRDGYEGSEAHTSCSSSDSEESQSVPQTPFEPVLLQYKENVSDDVNISHVSERPLPQRRTFVKRSADSDTAERAEPETTSSLSSTSTTEPTEVISYEVASFRSQSPDVTSCSSSEPAEVLEKSLYEMEGPEMITLKKQPRMDFGYLSHSASQSPQVTGSEEFENIQVLSSIKDVDRSEEGSPWREDLHGSAYIFGKTSSHSAEFKSRVTEDETVGENKALGIEYKAFEPAQLDKVPSVESPDSPVDIRESIQYAGREQPEDKLVDFGESPEVEYEIPKRSAHSFLVAHAEDEMLSGDLSGSQLGDGHRAKQTENNYIREDNFEVRSKEDELEINERGTEIKSPAAQTEVPWGRDQMELDDSLPEIRIGGGTHSSSLTMSGSATGEKDAAVSNMPANVHSARMKPARAFRVLPLQPSDDHMTSTQDVHTPSEEVAVGEIRDATKPRGYDQEDTWPLSLKSQEVSRDMAMGTSSLVPGLEEETVSTGAPRDTDGDVSDVVELSGSESTESVIFNETLSGDGRQEMRKRDADTPERLESAGSPFEARQGNPFASAAVGGVHVSEERSVTPEHVSSSVDVRPLRPEDQPNSTVQLGNGNYKIPAIVVMPSDKAGGIKEGGPLTEATKGIIASNAEWEDEGLDSGDDQSSVSSYGSELSGRKSHLSSALSAGRMGSLMSIYSDAGDYGNVLVQGAVEFAMMYSPAEELIIMVEQCQDLAYGSARKQRTDPYVKTYLLPDKFRRTKRKTSIKKNTNSPIYVESLRYKIKKKDLMDKTLHLSIWHNDSRGRNVFLGQVELNLKKWDWGHEALTWYNLQAKGGEQQESQDYRGTLFVALKYTPPVSTGGSKQNTGEVNVWLKEAKDLSQLKSNSVDSFVKCYMLPDTSKKSRQKTRVVKKSQSPVYNHAMVFDGFRAGEVREACCELTVWDHHKLSNQFLGGLRLSAGTGQSYGKKVDWMDSVNQEADIWEQMLAKPNNWVEAVIPLRSSMTPRK